MILLIDNYDSFVHNLARYLQRLGQSVHVVRNDRVTAGMIAELNSDAIVVSPGPCTPEEAGNTVQIVRTCGPRIPLLGICLGHQAIAVACGGRVVRADRPVHGSADAMYHDAMAEFAGMPQPFRAGRYHSLVVDRDGVPPELDVTARTREGTIMAIRHRVWPVSGWQFHPESVLTEVGYDLLANWLRCVGLSVTGPVPRLEDEVDMEPASVEALWFWNAT